MKKILSFVLFLLALIPTTTFAQVDDWDGGAEIWTHGSGTEADPYLIETAENLAWIAEMVNNGVTTYEGVYFRMTTDLNLKNRQWVPIGTDATNCFKGHFDGNDHLIDSIYVNNSTLTYLGLFGYTNSSVIENVQLKVSIRTGNYSAGLVAYADATSFNNCHIQGGTVIGKQYAGGMVAYCDNNCLIDQCSNFSAVTLSGNIYAAGGICGYLKERCTITKCKNQGDVSATKTSGGSSYIVYVGGICGRALNSNTTLITAKRQ